jgi:hypothetical protein
MWCGSQRNVARILWTYKLALAHVQTLTPFFPPTNITFTHPDEHMAYLRIDPINIGDVHDSFFSMCSPTTEFCGGVSNPWSPYATGDDSSGLNNNASPACTSDDQQSGDEQATSALDPEGVRPKPIVSTSDMLAENSGSREVDAISTSSDRHSEEVTNPTEVPSSGDLTSASALSASTHDTDESHGQVITLRDTDQSSMASSPNPVMPSTDDHAMFSVPAEDGSVYVEDGTEPTNSRTPDSAHSDFREESKEQLDVADRDIDVMDRSTPSEPISASEKEVGIPTAGSGNGKISVVFIDPTADDDEEAAPISGKRKSQFTSGDERRKRRPTALRKMAKGIRTNVRDPYLMDVRNHPVSEYV